MGFGSSRLWGKSSESALNAGAIWLVISILCELVDNTHPVFMAGILIGLAVFKKDWAQQREAADRFLGGEWDENS